MTTFELNVEPKNFVRLTKKTGESELVFGGINYNLKLIFTKLEESDTYNCWVSVNGDYLIRIYDIKYFEVMGWEND